MSLYEFRLEMEICGFPTWNGEHLEKQYKIYKDAVQKKISK
jgi:hypothetical protein